VSAAEMIFGELLGNVVRYARGPVSFHLNWHGREPTLLVTDEGPGFRRGTPRSELNDLNAESGRGLAMVRAFAVAMETGNRPERGAYVSVVLPVRRSDPDGRQIAAC
ncbi:MAG: ATP-binding protein, partial [Candidatus Eremiobacteraeota bacterium]|nr:ATP-binding protein [Candidatus Eremiobacteraeota bacterium]